MENDENSNLMKVCFGVDCNSSKRTKLSMKEILDVVSAAQTLHWPDNPNCRAEVFKLENENPTSVAAAFYEAIESHVKFMFMFSDPTGCRGVRLLVFGPNRDKFDCKAAGCVPSEENPSEMYVNPQAQTMNEQMSRVWRGEFVIGRCPDGKIVHGVYPEWCRH